MCTHAQTRAQFTLMHLCVHMCTHSHSVHTCTPTYVCTHMCTCVATHKTRTHSHMCAHSRMCTHKCTLIHHAHTCTQSHTCTHVHIHTHSILITRIPPYPLLFPSSFQFLFLFPASVFLTFRSLTCDPLSLTRAASATMSLEPQRLALEKVV